jgi:predicted nucleic acid-binding protein
LRFWDSSAVLPLLVGQATTPKVRELFAEDPHTCVWTLTDVEVRSALMRLERAGDLTPSRRLAAEEHFAHLWKRTRVVESIEAVKAQARRILGLHPLRAADALQLGAALVFAGLDPLGTELVCLDLRLADAARLEGFRILPDQETRSPR